MDAVLDVVSRKRFCFVSGKGGVGKTSASCALAIGLAKRRGKRVLLISTDPAHNVSDCLALQELDGPGSVTLGGSAQLIPGCEGRLWAVETDPSGSLARLLAPAEEEAGRAAPDLFGQLQEMLSEMREWLSSLPGIDEAVALLQILEADGERSAVVNGAAEAGNSSSSSGSSSGGDGAGATQPPHQQQAYDHIVLDTAPTGHTLKLLSLPRVLEIGIQRLEGWQVKMAQYMRMAMMFMRPPADGAPQQSPQEQLAAKLKQLKAGVETLKKVLTDADRTTFVCVGIAEALSVMESGRLLESLRENEIHSELMIVNHLYTKDFLGGGDEGEGAGAGAGEGAPPPGKKRSAEEMLDTSMAAKALALCRSRACLQNKHLAVLQAKHGKTHKIIQVPELAYEPRGIDGLEKFLLTWEA